ncbi:hypothetical protein ABIA32_006280 [Streptacidiphilus sp. MAP12-20]|uniref:hypothetical protein n=1 Tax=Streptacidiphilus sp. MAP12-20 TaxID=3156299 RepID=UPI003517AAAE
MRPMLDAFRASRNAWLGALPADRSPDTCSPGTGAPEQSRSEQQWFAALDANEPATLTGLITRALTARPEGAD